MFKEIKDEKNRFFQFESKDIIEKKDRKKALQTGYFESNLLCKNCDNSILGGYERYGANSLYSPKIKNGPIVEGLVDTHGNRAFKVSNIDYVKFKLFLLSILWRASISSHIFFSEVNLGPHEEKIRKMILDHNAKSDLDYPIIFGSILGNNTHFENYISQPRMFKFNEHKLVLFVITGIYYGFVVSSYVRDKESLKSRLNQKNELIMSHIPKGKDVEHFLKIIGIK
ncbi:hypothetical protein [Algoriphagus hitonicola]|nr:hypothetical protein [Algoriphagus hitonicola]